MTNVGRRKSNLIAWQGWNLELPARWDPVKLEGDYDSGMALFADLLRPRLGLRWQTPKKRRFDADAWVKQAIQNEIGQLAAEEAKPIALQATTWHGSMMYLDTEPPGRDVWFGYSQVSGRAIELTYHAHRRDRVLADQLLPGLLDLPNNEPMPWSIFDLSCVVPSGWKLAMHRLNAGDLSLSFTGKKRDQATIRQIAVAELALQRLPLDRWLLNQQTLMKRHYRVVGPTADISIEAGDRQLLGRASRQVRRRRFFFVRRLAPKLTTVALHDAVRDRLVICQGSDESAVQYLVKQVGVQ